MQNNQIDVMRLLPFVFILHTDFFMCKSINFFLNLYPKVHETDSEPYLLLMVII